VSVRLSVGGALLFEPLDLDFWHEVDLDLSYPEIVGQSRRSTVNLKQ